MFRNLYTVIESLTDVIHKINAPIGQLYLTRTKSWISLLAVAALFGRLLTFKKRVFFNGLTPCSDSFNKV